MPSRSYTPERGDFIWIDLYPRTGQEQSGHRPALVLSPKSYNRKTGLCIVCPATRQAKGYAFEVVVVDDKKQTSVILADHVRSVDWKARKAQLIQSVSQGVLNEVVAKLEALIISV
jgi:mRNA interferase MazF